MPYKTGARASAPCSSPSTQARMNYCRRRSRIPEGLGSRTKEEGTHPGPVVVRFAATIRSVHEDFSHTIWRIRESLGLHRVGYGIDGLWRGAKLSKRFA